MKSLTQQFKGSTDTMKNIIASILTLTLSLFVTACTDSTSATKIKEVVVATPEPTTLIKTDVKVGTGAEIKSGQTASVHYTGWLYDASAPDSHGKQFDSSRTRGTPFKFPLGASRVIKGWDQGVVGMKVGGQRTLTIPASLGYGARGAGALIPPNATLIFDVELMAIE